MIFLTQSALKQKEQELETLKTRLAEAREEKHLSFLQADGDGWHDNFGYEQALRDEKRIISEMNALLETIHTATIVDDTWFANQVNVNSNIVLKLDYGEGDVEEFKGKLVALPSEVMEGEISLNSPIGQAIIGKKEGDAISCLLNNGDKLKIEIISID